MVPDTKGIHICRLLLAEDDTVRFVVGQDLVAGLDLAGQQCVGQAVFQDLLDRALEWPCAINRVEADGYEMSAQFVGHRQLDVTLAHLGHGLVDDQVQDLCQFSLSERVEDDDLIHPVQELGTEHRLHVFQHYGGDARVCLFVRDRSGRCLDAADDITADVAGHYDDRVAEVNRTALAVRQAPVVQDLQQDVEHVGVGLLDLVQQDDRVRMPAYGLCQLPALFIANVSGRRADETADTEFLHVFAHVDADHAVLVVEQHLGQRLGQLGLADTGGAQEDEAADGTAGVRHTRARPLNGRGDGMDCLLLADDALCKTFLEVDQPGHLGLHHAGHRDTGPAADDLRDLLFGYRLLEFDAALLLRLELVVLSLDLLLQFGNRAILELCRLLEVSLARRLRELDFLLLKLLAKPCGFLDDVLLLVPGQFQPVRLLLQLGDLRLDVSIALLGLVIGLGNQRLAFHLQNNQFAVQFVDLDGHALELHLNQRRRLVHKVDGLIGQEPVGDVACRQLGCHDQGSIRDAHAVVRLIPFLQAAQDGDRILDRRLTDQDRLEATLQRSILFDDLAILVDRRGANCPQFASRERRLQHVGGIHGSLGRARPDDRVQLVDEHDDAAIAGRNGLEHGLEPVFELATKLRTRDHRAQVECKHDLVLEPLGNVPRHDTLRKRFDDCGLADAGIADEHRVVLGPAHEDLHDAPDLLVAADDWVQLALTRLLRQVAPVFLEDVILAFGLLIRHAFRSAHLHQRTQDGLLRHAGLLQQRST